MECYHRVPVLFVLLVLLASCGGGSSPVTQAGRDSMQNAAMEIRVVSEDPAHPRVDEFLIVTTTAGETSIRTEIQTAQDLALSRLLLNVHYDSGLIHPAEIEWNNVLSIDDVRIDVVADRIPGIVGLGQVSPGLLDIEVAASTTVAVITFETGPCKRASAASPEDVGLKLRSDECVEFQNCDVPFQVHALEGSDSVEVVWEEANDGDLNGDGDVTVSDLTPIGQLLDRRLEYTQAEENYAGYYYDDTENDIPDGYYLERDDLKEGLDHLRIHRIGVLGVLASAGNAYSPAMRYKDGQDPLLWDGNPTGEDIYHVTIHDETKVGQFFGNSTLDGYRLYVCTCIAGSTPNEGLFVVGGEPRTEDGWRVHRPTTLQDSLWKLGMQEYCGPHEKLTYEEFCTQKCTGAFERLGEDPYLIEPPIYKKILDVGDLPPGDSYVMVTPLPGSDAVDLFAGGAYGAYTYMEIPGTGAAVPEGIDWLNDEVGTEELQIGDSAEWPEGGERQLRLKFGVAELDWGAQLPDPRWEVRYAIYHEYQDGVDLWRSEAGLPARLSYPDIEGLETKDPTYDLVHPGAGEWYDLDDAPEYADSTVNMGVRAYAYMSTTLWNGEPHVERKALDLNTDHFAKEIPPDVLVDEYPPEGAGGSLHVSDAVFIAPHYLTTESAGFESELLTHALRRQHPRSTESTDHYLPTFFLPFGLLYGDGDILDYDAQGKDVPHNRLELRIEVYRTDLDRQSLIGEVAGLGGFIEWRQEKWQYESGDPRERDELQLYAVALSHPTRPEDSELPFIGLGTGASDYELWITDQIDGETVTELVLNTILSPAFPGSGYYDEYELIPYLSSTPFPVHSFALSKNYCTPDYSIEDEYAWEQYYVEGNIKCDTLFDRTIDLVYFQSDINYEHCVVPYDSSSQDPAQRWKYFSVYALNDEVDNCSYLPTGDLPIDQDVDRTICWHGHVPLLPDDFFSDMTVQEYDEYVDACRGLTYTMARGVSDTTVLEGRQARYPDVAYNSVSDSVGISYFDPLSGSVKVREYARNPLWAVNEEVDLASPGDTSLTYDDDGNPHVAYLRLYLEGEQEPVGGWAASRQGSTDRSASSMFSGGIYYRKRTAGNWSDREPVDEGGYLNAAEHALHIFSPAGQGSDPYCILPTDAPSLMGLTGVPGKSRRSEGWSTVPLPTQNASTQFSMDSVQVLQGNETITYLVLHDPIEESLVLGRLTDLEGWTMEVLVPGEVKGYPAIAEMADGSLGISYMGGTDNRLHYGEYTGGSFQLMFVSDYGQSGYQSTITYDAEGDPRIVSIFHDSAQIVMTELTNYGPAVVGLGFAGIANGLLEANTLDIERDRAGLGPASAFLVWINNRGVLRWMEIDFTE